MVDISTKAIERMATEKPKCGYIQPMLALAAERDELKRVQEVMENQLQSIRGSFHCDLVK